MTDVWTEEDLDRIVTEVIRRLAVRLNADGRRGSLAVVFTGATVGFSEALRQLHLLSMDGFTLKLAFSPMARELLASTVTGRLAGLPHVSEIPATEWLKTLKEVRGVLVPLLSVNSLSKISSLLADHASTNLILQGLFMGKPVIAARNGADPGDAGRKTLGFHRGNPALTQALLQRFRIAEDFGMTFTDIHSLRGTALSLVESAPRFQENKPDDSTGEIHAIHAHPSGILTAADVLSAHRLGVDLRIPPKCLITPLAQDFARRFGVHLQTGTEG